VLWWQRGRLSFRRDIAPLLPWLLLGAAAGLFTAWVERTLIGAEGAAFELTTVERCLLAGRVVWFYAAKLLWPANLTFVYPRWAIAADSLAQWVPLVAAVGLLVQLWCVRGRSRAPLAAALLYGGTLFPVLGFFNVYPFQYSFVADHFQYLASIPLIAFAVAAVSLAGTARSTTWPRVWAIAGCLLVLAFGTLTREQTRLYRDNQTLFRATIARNPGCWMAYNNLGKELMADADRRPEALTLIERAIALRPDYPEALNNLGLALSQAGRPREAIPHLEKSLRLKPKSFQTHNNLGIALASTGRAEDAVRAFEQAAILNPTLPNIHENWAKALLLLGRKDEADGHFAIAAKLRQAGTR
jgi:tetratricopeptide (TPR) repeat protein